MSDLQDTYNSHNFEVNHRAVITGIGVITPHGRCVEELCSATLKNVCAFEEVTRFSTKGFVSNLASSFRPETDATINGHGLQKRWMDRAVWYLLAALAQALKDANLNISDYDPKRIAISLGSSHSGLATTEELYSAYLRGELRQQDPRKVRAIPVSHIGSAVAAALGAHGPRLTISSACASSTGAMGCALDLIRDDRADLVVTGGTDTVSLAVMAGFNSLRALSPEGCAPFSEPAGITLGEGAGVLIIERLDRALKRGARLRSEILGYGLSGDAHHSTAPDSTGDGIRRVLMDALANANVKSDEIEYLSAHGTGTTANDAAESRASVAVFGKNTPLSSSKSIFGHTLGASGAIETILTLILAEKGKMPQTLNFKNRREGCEVLDYVPNKVREKNINTFICNNYGFGGNNASVVFRRTIDQSVGPSLSAKRKRVFITGIGTINTLGSNLTAISKNLWNNEPASDVNKLTHSVSPPTLGSELLRQIGRASPMTKYAVIATGEALESAGIKDKCLNEESGLIMGVVTSAQRSTEKFMESVFCGAPELASAHHFPSTTMNATGGQVSICYGLKGYNMTFCGTPSALGYSRWTIADGRQNRIVVCAADEMSDLLLDFYALGGIVRDQKVKPFDGLAGVNFGEGASSIVLESENEVSKRGFHPLAELVSFAEFQDGTHLGTKKNGNALVCAIREAGRRAQIGLEQIDVIFALGSGPSFFGQAETSALNTAFALQETPPIISPLMNTGYGPAHSPLFNIVAAVQALSTGLPEALNGHEGQKIPKSLKFALCVGIDITGLAHASIVGAL